MNNLEMTLAKVTDNDFAEMCENPIFLGSCVFLSVLSGLNQPLRIQSDALIQEFINTQLVQTVYAAADRCDSRDHRQTYHNWYKEATQHPPQ